MSKTSRLLRSPHASHPARPSTWAPASIRDDAYDPHTESSSQFGLGVPTGDSTWKSAPPRSATPSTPPTPLCEQCETPGKDVNYCNVCKTLYCDECWLQQFVHRKPKVGPGSVPHEKTTPKVYEMVRNALAPPVDDQVLKQMCRDDELTTWFGIERSSDNEPPMFQDYGRFGDLMSATDPVKRGHRNSSGLRGSQRARDTRTPSLISFVGQTGAGKSTLIKLLIDLNSEDTVSSRTTSEIVAFPTPVIGATGGHLPTSEDVHLYLDPSTAHSPSPILFADCEGLNGGERDPTGARMKKRRKHEEAMDGHKGRGTGAIKAISEQELTWADSPRTRTREYAVVNLYPRLLYTFSDVIIFVLTTPRVIENVFESLVTWAAAAIETSSNQPVLPHAIIVLNASKTEIDPKLWDVYANTSLILDDLANTVNQNETFKKYAKFWRSRGRTIDTLEQLVASYYSSFQILRVPAEGRPKLMQDQVGKLYSALTTASIAARANKSYLRMLLDVESLQSYLTYAFSHFSGSLDFPFDFVQASFINSPIPANFGGNILKLAINIMNVWQRNTTASIIFEAIGFMVASCIMFESARNNIPGKVDQIFPKYLEHIDAALENFLAQHWPCEFVLDGVPPQCVNVRNGHSSKGHQLKNGTVFATGGYICELTFASYAPEFRIHVYTSLEGLLDKLRKRLEANKSQDSVEWLAGGPVTTADATTADATTADAAATEIHRDSLRRFYRDIADGGSISERFSSHTACYSCLLEPPEHTLPCGHVLCTPCVRLFGRSQDPTVIEIRECPLEGKTRHDHWPWKLHTKPKSAGVRILVLDGGGMRGIVELEIMRAIEGAMGVRLPIQCFFDLIVGTSTGGLIALGLGAMNWTVEQCIEKFQLMCRTAFTLRKGASFYGVGALVEYYNHSKYETRPLEKTLKEAFTDNEYLFGGPKRDTTSRIKVAVTATSLTGNTAIVFGNYNRLCSEKIHYQFQRSERKDSEMKVWEAARATSAAPRFFKPFYHHATQKNLVDGAIWHNNPVKIAEQERKLIWPELEEQYPDIVLSLGTASSHRLRRTESKQIPATRGFVSHASDLVNLLKNHMATSIECERIWRNYLDQLPRSIRSTRFVRINPELPDAVPNIDDVDKMVPLQEALESWLDNQSKVKEVAMQLVATCFYFELLGSIINGKSEGYVAEGRICCRFPQSSEEMHELGIFLRRRGREPKFVIREQIAGSKTVQHVRLPPETVKAMILQRVFQMPLVSIKISERMSVTELSLDADADSIYPISGFPRSIFGDEIKYPSSRRSVSSDPNRWAGRSSRRKRVAESWKPPPPLKDVDNRRTLPAAIYTTPMQSQRHVPLPATKAKVRSQPLAGDGRPRVQLASRFFRMAFAALVNPVRSRSIPSYEEWLAELAPGSDATLETYHGLFHGKGKEPLPDPSINASGHDSITEFLKGGDRSSVAATLGDDDDYQVDPAQSRVYHEWLEGLQIQEVCRATADGLAHHLSELEGSIPPLLELDEYSSVGRLDLD